MRSVAKDFYVYVHRRETDGSIFYVGKGRGRRAWDMTNRNAGWKQEVRVHGCSVFIVHDGMSEPCALTLESMGISMIGLSNLANQRKSHRGANSGWSHSEDAKKRIREAGTGRKKSPEAIAKSRAAHLGVKRSPEVCERHRMAAQNRKRRGPHSEETRAKIAASHIGLKPSPEALAKMKSAVRPRGKDSPSYDQTIRTMLHIDGSIFTGTRAEFKQTFGAQDSCLSQLIKGKRHTVKGWKLK